MIADKTTFSKGAGLMVGFIVVFIILLLPIYDGKNALDYLDALYNSISKGSANYIPKLKEDIKKFAGKTINLTISMKDDKQAKEVEPLLVKSGVNVNVSGKTVKISGDMGKIFANCLDDADDMFNSRGEKVKSKYNYEERRVLYNWNDTMKKVDDELKSQKLFAESKMVGNVLKKGVECSYNYYKVTPQKIMDRIVIVIFSLIFYVIYTLWYGFSIMYMFEGWGMKLEH